MARLCVGSFVCVPLLHDGRLVALFGVNHNAPRPWNEADVALTEAVGIRTAAALEHLRTTARLRDSERQFRTLAETMPGHCRISDADGHVLWMNDRHGRFCAGTRALDGDMSDTVHPADQPAAAALWPRPAPPARRSR